MVSSKNKVYRESVATCSHLNLRSYNARRHEGTTATGATPVTDRRRKSDGSHGGEMAARW